MMMVFVRDFWRHLLLLYFRLVNVGFGCCMMYVGGGWIMGADGMVGGAGCWAFYSRG